MKKYIFLLIVLVSCQSSKKNACQEFEGIATIKIDLSDYKGNSLYTENSSDSSVTVVFANNPYCLDSSDWIKLYANNSILFSGNYSQFKEVKMPGTEKSIHFSLEVLSGDGGFKSFQDKSIVPWQNEFKFIYIGFFPSNDNTDQIHFFPEENAVVQ